MNRRTFFALLLAPFLNKFRRLSPHREPTIEQIVEARMCEAVRLIYQELEADFYLSGQPIVKVDKPLLPKWTKDYLRYS